MYNNKILKQARSKGLGTQQTTLPSHPSATLADILPGLVMISGATLKSSRVVLKDMLDAPLVQLVTATDVSPKRAQTGDWRRHSSVTSAPCLHSGKSDTATGLRP